MKLLWLSHLLPYPPHGGAMQRSYHLIKQVAQFCQLDLLAFNQTAQLSRPEEVNAAIDEFKGYCNKVEVFQIPSDKNRYGRQMLAASSLFSLSPYTVNWLRSRDFNRRLKSIVEAEHYDLVWLDTVSFAPYLDYFKTSKTILNHHNIESDMMFRRSSKESGILQKFYFYQEAVKLGLVEKRTCPKCTLNVTCSPLDSVRLEKVIPGLKTAVVPNGVDIGYFTPSIKPPKKNSMVFAGDMSWYPNREAMVYLAEKIWPLLKNNIPDSTMSVIGRNAPEEVLKLSKQDNSFKVTGFVDDVRPYISNAAIYICPIMNGGGTKLKILDALSAGKAIVAHPVACEGIDVVDSHSVLFADTPEMFVEKIQQVFTDEQFRKKLEKNGRELVEKRYSFDYIGKELKKDLEALNGVTRTNV